MCANLLNAYLIDNELYVAISLNSSDYTRTIYNNSGIGYDNMKKVVDYLSSERVGHIVLRRGFQSRRSYRTRIRMKESLYRVLCNDELGGNDTECSTSSSTSPVTNRISPSIVDISLRSSFPLIRLKDSEGKLIAYEEAEQTRLMKARLSEWNQFCMD